MSSSIRAKAATKEEAIAHAKKWMEKSPGFWEIKNPAYWQLTITGWNPLNWNFVWIIELHNAQIEEQAKGIENAISEIMGDAHSAPTPDSLAPVQSDTTTSYGAIAEMLYWFYSKNGIPPADFENLSKNGFMEPNGRATNGSPSYSWTDKAHELVVKFTSCVK
jgi:hypothetical protein